MSYRYEDLRPRLFTEEGSVMFTQIRDHAKELLKQAGAFTMGKAMAGARSGDSWLMLACVDRLVELREIREITGCDVWAQDRVFVARSA